MKIISVVPGLLWAWGNMRVNLKAWDNICHTLHFAGRVSRWADWLCSWSHSCSQVWSTVWHRAHLRAGYWRHPKITDLSEIFAISMCVSTNIIDTETPITKTLTYFCREPGVTSQIHGCSQWCFMSIILLRSKGYTSQNIHFNVFELIICSIHGENNNSTVKS